MKKIATHNSCTGERGKGILSFLVAPFSICQSKTLEEQFDAGCRMFDIRVKYDKDHNFVIKHGAWTCSLTFDEVLAKLRAFQIESEVPVYLRFTYEGNTMDNVDSFIKDILHRAHDFTVIDIHNKFPYKRIWYNKKTDVTYKECFVGMPVKWGRWEWLMPFPWLWKKLRYDNPEFDDECFKVVDFL